MPLVVLLEDGKWQARKLYSSDRVPLPELSILKLALMPASKLQ